MTAGYERKGVGTLAEGSGRAFTVASTAERDLLIGVQEGNEAFIVDASNVVQSAWVYHNGGWRPQPPAGAHGNLGAHTEPGAVLNLKDGVAPTVSGDGGPLPAYPTARIRSNHRRSSLVGWEIADDETNDRNDLRAYFGSNLARGAGFWARQSGGLGTSAALVNDSVRYHPMDVSTGAAIDRLGFGITAMGGATTGSIRLAVHRSDPETGAPATNGLITGTNITVPFSSLSAAFIQVTLAVTLPVGRLWMCMVPQGFDVMPTFQTLTNTQDGVLSTSVPSAAGNNHTGYSETIGAGAAIPASLAALIVTTTPPLIWVRTA